MEYSKPVSFLGLGRDLRPLIDAAFCSIRYPDGMGHTTMAKSLFEGVANALHWAEVDCATFGSAKHYRDDQVLVIGVGMMPDRWYRVRIGRIRRWIREAAGTDCEG